MAEVLALDWDRTRLCGAAAEIAGDGTLNVQHLFTLPWPDGPAGSPNAIGQWLRGELDRLGVTTGDTVVALPRDDVVLRQLRLPAAPDDELAELVRLQTATKSIQPIDELVIDFVPFAARPDEEGRDVLAATFPAERLQQITAALTAARLRPLSVCLSCVATGEPLVAELERRKADTGEANLLVARISDRIEISVVRSGCLLFAHSARIDPAGDRVNLSQLVLTEVRRATIALGRVQPEVQIARVWTLGELADVTERLADVTERLAVEFTCEITPLDLSVQYSVGDSEAGSADFAAALGMLRGRAKPKLAPLDFLNPRRPPSRGGRNKLRLGILAAGIVIVAAAGYVSFRNVVRDLDDEISQRRQQLSHLQAVVDRGQPLLASAARIDAWEGQEVDWLVQMRAVQAAMPGSQRIYLTGWRLENVLGQTAGRVRADGYAADRSDIQQWSQLLADRPRFRVLPPEIIDTPSNSKYPFRFELDVDLLPADKHRGP